MDRHRRGRDADGREGRDHRRTWSTSRSPSVMPPSTTSLDVPQLMAREKALYPGHAVAAVAATTELITAQAASSSRSTTRCCRVIEIDDAMNRTRRCCAISPNSRASRRTSPDVGRSRRATSQQASRGRGGDRAELHDPPGHQGYIEPHACLISVAADGKTVIWSSSHGQFMVRAMVAYLTGIPQSDIRAIPAEIGGGFGGKTIVYLEPLATLLAKNPAGRSRS